jgi:hypothetical protein
MKTIELSQFTNKELKDILKKNQVKNYSKLNKKDLIKKVNQLTNSQNGGGGAEYTEVGGVRIPTHMMAAQRGKPPVQQTNAQPAVQVNIAQPAMRRVNNPPDPFNFLQPHISRQLRQAGPAPLYAHPLNAPPRVQAYAAPPPYPPPPLNAPPLQLNTQRHLLPPSLTAQRHTPPQSRPRNAAQNRIICPSPGWAQQRNDCWIDSAYYAMFVPSNLQNWFIPFFIGISVSEIEQLKNFSRLSLDYLQGIDGNQDFLLRKQGLKKNILISIKNVLEEESRRNPQARSILEFYNSVAISNNYNSTGLMNTRGYGDAFIFFQFISLINKKLRFFQRPSWTEVFTDLKQSNQSNQSKIIQNYIKRRLHQDSQRIDIVVIDASYSASQSVIPREIELCMNDNTVLQEILDINGFSLEAVIRGDNVHYRVDFRCSDNKWYNYDNDRRPNHIIEIDVRNRNWQGNDGLIFIFRRRP